MIDANLYTLFESRFPADRGLPLLILDPGREVSYAEVDATSARCAMRNAFSGQRPNQARRPAQMNTDKNR